MHKPSPKNAFTIIELLIVISIIAILSAMLLVGLSTVRKRAKISNAQVTIQSLDIALNAYKTAFGEFPPTQFEQIKNGFPTATNGGIESLVQCLTTTQKGGPFIELKDDMFINSDNDSRSSNPVQSAIVATELFEIVDPWGNPFVYIRAIEYSNTGLVVQDSLGKQTPSVAVKSKITKTYEAPYTYQIWSFGPNGINENGANDDIISWKTN